MIFGDLLKKIKRERPSPKDAPKHWIKCKSCQAIMYQKEIAEKFFVCPKCDSHMRIEVSQRIEMLCDEGSFLEHDKNLKPVDPLSFVDKKSYKQRIEESFTKTNRYSSTVCGSCKINGIDAEIVVFDFSFMGGSLGSVEGEKIVRAAKRAIQRRVGLVIISASGGARMQESTFSLMQMAKTSAVLKELSKNKLPFISILTDPTFGGVSASFAMLGDIIIAEPGTIIGFAGARVIKQTIGAELPKGFQSAEFLLEHGLIDMVEHRVRLKSTVSNLLKIMTK